jgi:hypothetical protein
MKFEYLSFCLKVKEMDDEEVSYATIGEPLYRVEAGNIEYRYLYNNLARPFTTVCAFSISSQTRGPRPPNFSQAVPLLHA